MRQLIEPGVVVVVVAGSRVAGLLLLLPSTVDASQPGRIWTRGGSTACSIIRVAMSWLGLWLG
jgi:hypothetical protein